MRELERFSPTLAQRERWLVLNKSDLLDAETFAARREAVVAALDWQGPVYAISAIKGEGTAALCGDMMIYLEECRAAELADPELAEAERQMQFAMQDEARQRMEEYRARQRERSGEKMAATAVRLPSMMTMTILMTTTMTLKWNMCPEAPNG